MARDIDETNVRCGSRTYEHSFTDEQSAMFKLLFNYTVSRNDFQIFEKGFNKKVECKIGEALFIEE